MTSGSSACFSIPRRSFRMIPLIVGKQLFTFFFYRWLLCCEVLPSKMHFHYREKSVSSLWMTITAEWTIAHQPLHRTLSNTAVALFDEEQVQLSKELPPTDKVLLHRCVSVLFRNSVFKTILVNHTLCHWEICMIIACYFLSCHSCLCQCLCPRLRLWFSCCGPFTCCNSACLSGCLPVCLHASLRVCL